MLKFSKLTTLNIPVQTGLLLSALNALANSKKAAPSYNFAEEAIVGYKLSNGGFVSIFEKDGSVVVPFVKELKQLIETNINICFGVNADTTSSSVVVGNKNPILVAINNKYPGVSSTTGVTAQVEFDPQNMSITYSYDKKELIRCINKTIAEGNGDKIRGLKSYLNLSCADKYISSIQGNKIFTKNGMTFYKGLDKNIYFNEDELYLEKRLSNLTIMNIIANCEIKENDFQEQYLGNSRYEELLEDLVSSVCEEGREANLSKLRNELKQIDRELSKLKPIIANISKETYNDFLAEIL